MSSFATAFAFAGPYGVDFGKSIFYRGKPNDFADGRTATHGKTGNNCPSERANFAAPRTRPRSGQLKIDIAFSLGTKGFSTFRAGCRVPPEQF
jgi:hypothetical protein